MVVNIVFYKVVEIIILKQKILSTPKYTIQQLLDYKYYDENIPICLFPDIDIFVGKINIDHLIKIY